MPTRTASAEPAVDAVLSAEQLEQLASWLPVSLEHDHHPSQLAAADSTLRQFHVAATATNLLECFPNDLVNVALQFPDSLLHLSPFLAEALTLASQNLLRRDGDNAAADALANRKQPSRTFFYYVLADTSYGECCVDEVAAQHLSPDVVVHYGPACLSPTSSLPVMYVFPDAGALPMPSPYDRVRDAIASVVEQSAASHVVLLYDVELHSHFSAGGFATSDARFPLASPEADVHVVTAELCVPPLTVLSPADFQLGTDSHVTVGPLKFAKLDSPLSDTAFLWLSRDFTAEEFPHAALRNAALTFSSGMSHSSAGLYHVALATPAHQAPTPIDGSRALRKRFAQLARLHSAERIGIIAGTLAMSGNVPVIQRCMRVIHGAGKRAYSLLVGKPNVAKLANFPELDAFVLVACPQNALLDSHEFMQPIVTPLELEAALLRDGDIFSEPYSLDIRELLKSEVEIGHADESNGELQNDEARCGAVTNRDEWTVSVTGHGAAGDFLSRRQWRGLVYDKGGSGDETDLADLPVEITAGQVGIAGKYQREKQLGDSHADNDGS